jgi:hypothetical protein
MIEIAYYISQAGRSGKIISFWSALHDLDSHLSFGTLELLNDQITLGTYVKWDKVVKFVITNMRHSPLHLLEQGCEVLTKLSNCGLLRFTPLLRVLVFSTSFFTLTLNNSFHHFRFLIRSLLRQRGDARH